MLSQPQIGIPFLEIHLSFKHILNTFGLNTKTNAQDV